MVATKKIIEGKSLHEKHLRSLLDHECLVIKIPNFFLETPEHGGEFEIWDVSP